MSEFNFGIDQATESINLENQIIDAGVSILDPVWFDDVSSTWKKSDNKNLPKGIYQGLNIVIISGKFLGAAASFVVNTNYYLADAGGLTILRTATFVGRSISDTILLVDIDTPTSELLRIAGYSAGGFGATVFSIIDKLTFSSSIRLALTSNLSFNIAEMAGLNSNQDGYIIGNTVSDSTINKINFISETRSINGSGLVQVRKQCCGFESSLAGYTTGGAPITDTIEKLDFNTGNNSTLVGQVLSSVLQQLNDSGYNSNIAGYTSGGTNNAVPAVNVSNIDKLTFSTDTNSASGTFLALLGSLSAGAESEEAGYYMYGLPNPNNNIHKLIFSIDSSFQFSTVLANSAYARSGFNSSLNAYTFGGGVGAGFTDAIIELNFINDTNMLSSTVLSVARKNQAGFEN